MAKLIQQIYNLIALATDKGLTSYHSDAQIMNVVDSVQMNLYRPLIENFAKTKQIRNELLPFMERANITIISKVGPLPEDFEHDIEFWASVNGVNQTIRLFEGGVFRRRLQDPIDVPSTTNLIGNIFNDGSGKQIEISNQVTPIVINYFRRPVKPIYATTISGGTPIYDDVNSVDVEWTSLVHDIIVERSLLLLGLSIRDGQVQRVGASPVPKEATITA